MEDDSKSVKDGRVFVMVIESRSFNVAKFRIRLVVNFVRILTIG